MSAALAEKIAMLKQDVENKTSVKLVTGNEVEAAAEKTKTIASESVKAQDGATAKLLAQLEELKAENERLRNVPARGLSMKVSEKGGVSVYGLGRFPVTLYREQWTRLAASMGDVEAFIVAHDKELKVKEVKAK